MKLASVNHGGRGLVVAAAGDDRLIDVDDLLAEAGRPRLGGDMIALIAAGAATLADIAAALARASDNPGTLHSIAAAAVTWQPPVRAPGKICAVAMNNSASNARKISAPSHPAFFLKPPSCLIGHGEPIRIRRYYGSVHPEPELAVVIGRTARDVAARDALDHIFGYTIFDDVTGNGMRAEDRFHYYAVYAKPGSPDETERVEQHLSYAARYKGTDTFGVMGPWLVTADAVADPDDLNVHCTIHGATIAEDSTRYYNYKVAEVVSFLSQFLTLHPGDVLSLGTAFKPAANRKSIHHANLQTVPGPIEIRIDGLGTQTSPVIVEDKELGQWRLS
jgi:2,4-didehydro-3-deoxy-L-rhamnonate hydrolase